MAKLIPPRGSVAIRMYRIGHGDCFLLAFPGKKLSTPTYVLIDCGYKPGSPAFINTTVEEITADIRDATGGHIDVAIITHEHQDHVNGISASNFSGITIGEAWFAWTEDPDDEVANDLRKSHKDQLLGLLAARNRLKAAGEDDTTRRIDRFLAFELGGDDERFDVQAAQALLSAAGRPENSRNKQSMKVFKDMAADGPRFLRPHGDVRAVPGAKEARVFVLGPPRNAQQLRSLDPRGDEEFHLSSPVGYFGAAARAVESGAMPQPPFAPRYCLPWIDARAQLVSTDSAFLITHYGRDDDSPIPLSHPREVASNAEWRRIDRDWLLSAEQLALDMNSYTNNASLVLAFELSRGGKVLLFAGDAQRGNWVSWSGAEWNDGDRKVTARDLLSRAVLYKVGHHGSHNATLNGTEGDDHPNLSWMAAGERGREFTAMITAVRKWAETQDGWDHPQKAIKDALLRKAAGRVFQTDTDVTQMTMPEGSVKADWKAFRSRTAGQGLYFDYRIRVKSS